MIFIAEGKNPFLGAAGLLVTTGAAEGRIEFIMIEGLFQRLRLHHVRMQRRAVGEGADAPLHAFLIDMDQKFQPIFLHDGIAKMNHVAEFPGGVDMKKRKGHRRGIKSLACQMQQNSGILTDGIEHDGILKFRRHFPEDMNALRLKLSEMG